MPIEIDALYDFDGIATAWAWDNTGFSLDDATVYAVEFN